MSKTFQTALDAQAANPALAFITSAQTDIKSRQNTPKTAETRTKRINLCVSPALHKRIKRNAGDADLTIAEYAEKLILSALDSGV